MAGVLLLGLRYRRLQPELRLQVRWPLAATICFAGLFALGLVVPDGAMPNWLSQLLWYEAAALSHRYAFVATRVTAIQAWSSVVDRA